MEQQNCTSTSTFCTGKPSWSFVFTQIFLQGTYTCLQQSPETRLVETISIRVPLPAVQSGEPEKNAGASHVYCPVSSTEIIPTSNDLSSLTAGSVSNQSRLEDCLLSICEKCQVIWRLSSLHGL